MYERLKRNWITIWHGLCTVAGVVILATGTLGAAVSQPPRSVRVGDTGCDQNSRLVEQRVTILDDEGISNWVRVSRCVPLGTEGRSGASEGRPKVNK